jgi:hypothetical protein
MTPGAFKACACGAEYSAVGWALLERVGEHDDLALRNCRCGSTCAVHVAEDAIAELARVRHVIAGDLAPAELRVLSQAAVQLEQRVRDLVARLCELEDALDARDAAE